MKTSFKFLILLVLVGLSGYFSYVVTMFLALGGVQNQWVTIPFYIFALLSLVSSFTLVLKNRVNLKNWHIVILWLIYLSPAIFIFTLVFSVTQIRQFKELNNDKKEVVLLMQKFYQQALPQGGYPNLDFFSNFGYGAVCNGDWTNELHPAHQVSKIRRILGKGNRELALSSVSCISDKSSYALSVKFSNNSIKCIDKTGYFGPASTLNSGTTCLR